MNGALLLGMITVVLAADYMIALRFLAIANRAEGDVGAAPAKGTSSPEGARRTAKMLFISAPIMWLVVALLSFGIIPIDGIIPIKF